jgi:hypothetical protein
VPAVVIAGVVPHHLQPLDVTPLCLQTNRLLNIIWEYNVVEMIFRIGQAVLTISINSALSSSSFGKRQGSSLFDFFPFVVWVGQLALKPVLSLNPQPLPFFFFFFFFLLSAFKTSTTLTILCHTQKKLESTVRGFHIRTERMRLEFQGSLVNPRQNQHADEVPIPSCLPVYGCHLFSCFGSRDGHWRGCVSVKEYSSIRRVVFIILVMFDKVNNATAFICGQHL